MDTAILRLLTQKQNKMNKKGGKWVCFRLLNWRLLNLAEKQERVALSSVRTGAQCLPIILALGKYRQEDQEFKASDGDGWIKTTNCSCRGPKFVCQHLHGCSWPPVTPVPGYPKASSELPGHCVQTWWTYIHTGKLNKHTCRQNTQHTKKATFCFSFFKWSLKNNPEFKVFLGYIASSRLTWATEILFQKKDEYIC